MKNVSQVTINVSQVTGNGEWDECDKIEVTSHWYTCVFHCILFLCLISVTYEFIAPCLPKKCLQIDPMPQCVHHAPALAAAAAVGAKVQSFALPIEAHSPVYSVKSALYKVKVEKKKTQFHESPQRKTDHTACIAREVVRANNFISSWFVF